MRRFYKVSIETKTYEEAKKLKEFLLENQKEHSEITISEIEEDEAGDMASGNQPFQD